MSRIISLWVHPRSLSTAMERVFIERGDVAVVHEPFSYLYFFHEKKGYIPHGHPDPTHPRSYGAIVRMLDDLAHRCTVFHKDICYHCSDHIAADTAFLLRRTNTFLIRHPQKAIVSYASVYRRFNRDQLGYRQLYAVFRSVMRLLGRPPVVVDADDLQRTPATTVAAYCRQIGLPMQPASLEWQPGLPPQWANWREWHLDAAASTGIRQDSKRYDFSVLDDPYLADCYAYHLPFYEEMRKYKLAPAEKELVS